MYYKRDNDFFTGDLSGSHFLPSFLGNTFSGKAPILFPATPYLATSNALNTSPALYTVNPTPNSMDSFHTS